MDGGTGGWGDGGTGGQGDRGTGDRGTGDGGQGDRGTGGWGTGGQGDRGTRTLPRCTLVHYAGCLASFLFRYQCKYKFEAMRGLGVDRHMFGLYVVAKGMNMDPLPRMFQDKV